MVVHEKIRVNRANHRFEFNTRLIKQWLIRIRISHLPGGRIRIDGPGPGEDIHRWIRGDAWSRWISRIHHSRIIAGESEVIRDPGGYWIDHSRISVIRDPGGYPWSTTREYPPGDPRRSVIRDPDGYPGSIILGISTGGSEVIRDPVGSGLIREILWSLIFKKTSQINKLNQFNHLHLIFILSHGV